MFSTTLQEINHDVYKKLPIEALVIVLKDLISPTYQVTNKVSNQSQVLTNRGLNLTIMA